MTTEEQEPEGVDITIEQLARDGRPLSASELLPLIYEDLRSLASAKIARRKQTLQATALVHEAWMRVVGQGDPGWECRAHFFGAAAHAMRRILVEQARRRSRLRHGGGFERTRLLDLPDVQCDVPMEDLLTLEDALEELERRSFVQAKVVMLRFFAGLTMVEIAELQGLSLRRVEREWAFARAWLEVRVTPEPDTD